MRKIVGKNLLVFILIAGFFATAVLHVLFMDEIMSASQACLTGIAQTQDCHQPQSVKCCAAEATSLQNFLQVTPRQFPELLISAAAMSFAPLLLLMLLYQSGLFAIFQSRLKMLRLRILAFHHQIGSWLTLLEKRAPARHVWWRGFGFA